MTGLWRQVVLLSAAAVLAACGGRKPEVQELSPQEVISALVVDTVIQGTILGQPLRAPYGVAVDFRGNVYVTEAGNHRLLSFAPDLTPRREIGGFGGEVGLLNRPGFVTVDNGLTLLVADRGNLRLVRYNATLTFVNEISLLVFDDLSEFGEPSGVALSGYGEIWVADRDRDRIAVFDNVNKFERYVAEYGYSGGQVAAPEKLLEAPDGGFWACDAGNGRINAYDQYGNYLRSLGAGQLGYPVAAALDNERRIWVLDGERGGVTCLAQSGAVLFESSAQITGLDRPLKGATDIEVLADGRLLVVDSGNDRLVVSRILTNDQ